MTFYLRFVQPKFSGFVFGFVSAITTVVFLIGVRAIVGTMPGIGETITGGQQMAANAALGLTLTSILAIATPMAFITGFVTGYVFAIIHNSLARSLDLVKVPEGSFEFKE